MSPDTTGQEDETMTTTTYTVTAHDSETPIMLPPTARIARLLGQDSGRYTVAIVTTDPTALEAALEADATVIRYEAGDDDCPIHGTR